MNTVDKEKELNNYIREWIDVRYCDWRTFYHDVQINKRSGIYLLKRGCELFDFLSNIISNIEEHLIAEEPNRIIPSKFSSIDQFLCFVRNLKQYISDNYPLLEINLAGEDTSYMVITMCEIVDAVNNMAERCLNVYLREEHAPEPYSLMRRSLAKGEIDTFMTTLKAVISDIPYGIRKTEFNEAYFHIIVHVITSVLGFEPVSERETSDGRIDCKHSIVSEAYCMNQVTFALQNIKNTIMASSEDFKRILELYNQESKTSGVSIVAFCQKNGIVYSQFERWYKNRHKVKVHAVEIVERDGTIPVQDTKLQDTCDNAVEVSEPQDVRLSKPTLFTIQLKSTNGMYFQQRNIDYNGLKDLVEKLEVLCSR